MTGIVDDAGRALVGVLIVSERFPEGVNVDVGIDTAFTGDLVFPQDMINQLGMTKSGSVDAILTANRAGLQDRRPWLLQRSVLHILAVEPIRIDRDPGRARLG
jgi:hypothetical protein